MVELSLSRTAWLLNTVGGILMIVYGSYGLLMSLIGGYQMSSGFVLSIFLTLTCGVLAMIWANRYDSVKWSIVLIAIGIVGVVGGGAGGFFVAIGGVIGLVQTTH